jgi:hypothetical protein
MRACHSRSIAFACVASVGATLVVTASARQSGPGDRDHIGGAGHTPGTISTLIPVRDQGRPHLAALWGGTGFNVTITTDHAKPYWFDTYARSARATILRYLTMVRECAQAGLATSR